MASSVIDSAYPMMATDSPVGPSWSSSSSYCSPQPSIEADGFLSPAPPADSSHSPDLTPKLIIPPSLRRRHPRQPTLQPSNASPQQAPTPTFAIHSHIDNSFNIQSRQDVLPFVNAASSRPPANTSTTLNGLLSPVSTSSSTHHVSLNTNNSSPRTPNQVFLNTNDLATHYGIPQFLPPAPRTTPRRLSQHEPIDNISSTTSPLADFESMRSNYLNMLSQKPDDVPTVEEPTMIDQMPTPLEESVQAVVEALKASPHFQTYGDFLTSPFDDSPFDDFLTTPDISADGFDFTSPVVADSFAESFGELPLFGDGGIDPSQVDESKSTNAQCPTPASSLLPDFDNLVTISPDTSPTLDPSSLATSFEMPTRPARRKGPTGTRKNITPNSLVPLDAPTQPRTYTTPSATSRKEVPAVYARKRARSQAFGDEEDELEEIELPLNPTDAQIIEATRRRNTIAARRSRKRKLEYTRHLEETVEVLTKENEMWKQRTLACEALMKSHGVPVPERS